jgi:hypothetical protein
MVDKAHNNLSGQENLSSEQSAGECNKKSLSS